MFHVCNALYNIGFLGFKNEKDSKYRGAAGAGVAWPRKESSKEKLLDTWRLQTNSYPLTQLIRFREEKCLQVGKRAKGHVKLTTAILDFHRFARYPLTRIPPAKSSMQWLMGFVWRPSCGVASFHSIWLFVVLFSQRSFILHWAQVRALISGKF